MKSPMLSIVLVAIVAGAVGALCASLLSNDAVPPSAANAPATAATRAADATTDARANDARLVVLVDSLAADVERLSARVEELERRPEPDLRAALAPSTNAESAGESAALAPHAVQESVAQALDEIRAQERAQAAQQREQRELERIDERVTRMSETLTLSAGQANDLRAHMIEQRAAREALEAQRDQYGDREAYRAALEEVRKREVAGLTRILSPTQFETLRERERARDDERNRGRRGGNDRRGR